LGTHVVWNRGTVLPPILARASVWEPSSVPLSLSRTQQLCGRKSKSVSDRVDILNLKWGLPGEPFTEPRLADSQRGGEFRLREPPPSHQFFHVDLKQGIRGLRLLVARHRYSLESHSL
jgi:hypothetical protein